MYGFWLRAGAIVTAALRFPSFFCDILISCWELPLFIVAVMSWSCCANSRLGPGRVPRPRSQSRSIPKLLPRHRRDSLSALGLAEIFFCLIESANGPVPRFIFPTTSVDGTVVFKPWSDFFTHATIVARSLGAETLSH